MKQAPLIGQVLSQRQSAILAPQLQQGVRMLQLSSIELHEELELALQQNPFLEKLELDTEFDYVESKSDQPESVHVDIKRGNTDSGIIQGTLSQPFFRSPVREGSTAAGIRPDTAMAAGYGPEPHMTDEPGLQEYLRQQAAIAGLTSRQRFIMELLIDSVNDRGYLRASLKEIVQLAMPEYVVTEKQVAGLLKILQGFDPVGVGARNSRECLLLQLDDLRADSGTRELARLIVKSYLIQLAKGDYLTITEKTGRSEAEVRESIGLIRQLNPFPGDSIGSVSAHSIVPDLIVKKRGEHWQVHLNPNVTPTICLHHESNDLLGLARGQRGYDRLKQTFQEARVLLSNIEKRFRTLHDVARSIVERQNDFLDQGVAELRPLTQKEIAAILGIHVSTVSRAVNGKYILTPNGTIELKALFSSGLSQKGGGQVSARAIEVQIQQLIAAESAYSPLSDLKITELLNEQGIRVARRTVMKYRERLSIPASPGRRKRKLSGE